MTDPEKTLAFLEELIPALSASAFLPAYERTLAAGYSVLEVREGNIYEVFPDGTTKFVKQSEPRIPVDIGKIIEF